MSDNFKNPNDFDQYASEHGGWEYDNGWRYQDRYFGASFAGKVFGNVQRGEHDHLQMLREGDESTRTVIIHIVGSSITEIWSGEVCTKIDFDRMMDSVNEYILQYEKERRARPSGA